MRKLMLYTALASMIAAAAPMSASAADWHRGGWHREGWHRPVERVRFVPARPPVTYYYGVPEPVYVAPAPVYPVPVPAYVAAPPVMSLNIL